MNLLGTSKSDLNTRATILNLVQKRGQVIYGARAINKQLPTHLQKETSDYDVLTKKPEQSAKELAEKLNKIYGEGEFKVEKAKYSKTWKVKSKEGKTVADYTLTTKKPKSVNEFGVRYANLEYQKGKIKKILKDEASSFRHDKDRETLDRIKKGEFKRW